MAFDLLARLRLDDKFSGPLRNATEKAREFARQTDAISKSARSMGDSVRGGFGILDKTIGSVTFGQLGLAGAVAGVGYALKSSTEKAMAFEAQMSSIKALTGLTNGEMSEMQALVMKLGQDTKYSALEVAQGAEEMLKAGLTMNQLKTGALEAGLNLATAGGLDLAEASEIMSTALNTFKRDGMQASDAANLLAGAANASATSVHELKYAMSAVGVVAAGVHMSFKDASTAMAVFAQNGLKGSDAGTSLKTMLANLSPRTKGAMRAFQELGLITKDGTNKLFNAKGEIKDLASVAEELRKAMQHLNPKEQGEYLYEMFGSDAIRAGTILVKEGAAGVKKMYEEMSKVTALQVAKEKMNNAQGAVEQFQGALETLQISALMPTMPLIKDLANGLSDLAADATPAITAFTTDLSNGVKGFFNELKNDEEFQKLGWGDKLITAMDRASDEFSSYMQGPGGEKFAGAIAKTAEVGTKMGLALGGAFAQGAASAIASSPTSSAIAGAIAGLAVPGGPIIKAAAAVGGAIAGALTSEIVKGVNLALEWAEGKRKEIEEMNGTPTATALNKVDAAEKQRERSDLENEKLYRKNGDKALPKQTPVYQSGEMTAAKPKGNLGHLSDWWHSTIEPKLPRNLRGNYHGLADVPYDNMVVRVHKGEGILTAQENKEYRQGKGTSVTIGNITINGAGKATREMAYEIASIISQEIELAGGNA
jgi:TP901 family phage tail tape measure protein